MAAKFQHEKPLEDMMRNLKVDPSSDVGNNNKAGTKGGNHLDANTFVPSPGVMINNVKGDMGQEYLISDQGGYYPMNGYYGYYYPGFDGSFGEWDEQAYFSGPDGVELQYPVVQGDNGQLFYYTPGFQFGYDAYGSPYMPGTMVGMDGQYMSQQPFFPGAVLQQPVSSQVFSPPPVAYGNDMFPAYTWETSPLAINGTNGNGMVSGLTVPVQKSNLSSSTHTVAPAKSAAPPKSHNTIEKDTKPMIDALPSNQTLKPANKVSQQASTLPASTALAKGYFPISKFPDKSGLLYPGAIINPKASGQGWIGPEKLKGRGKANGLTGFDWLNEQNRGPRTTGPKNSLTSNGDSVGNTNSVTTSAIQKDYYNLSDFQTKYDHAMFYVIKSYSEDDVHKSIKYNVWASTTNGNKRLENTYQDAQKKIEEKGSKCPVFLFFSVNASGQFCGVAEMTGRVDFDKSMDFWQQDKWTGFFPVKWHIIKDVPNTQFRHIILENNDNKPVTNSRDAQEVKFSQGIEMLNIFKNYSAKTSILDDFGFYESRQKIMQDKRVRPLAAYPEHFQKKIDDALKVPEVGALETDTNPSTKLAVIKDELELSGGSKGVI